MPPSGQGSVKEFAYEGGEKRSKIVKSAQINVGYKV